MKTTYILAGGNDRGAEDFGERLSQEIARHVSAPKILSCFYATPQEVWKVKYQDWKKWLPPLFGECTCDYALPDTFLEQIDEADVIYLHGGENQLLLKGLPDIQTLTKRSEGKVVVGSSAGANALSKYFWSGSKAIPGVGLGIVNKNVMVHYGAPNMDGRMRTDRDWEREEAAFRAFIGDGIVTRLPEGQFVVDIT